MTEHPEKTLEIFQKTLEIFLKTLEIFPKTMEIFPKTMDFLLPKQLPRACQPIVWQSAWTTLKSSPMPMCKLH